MTIEELLVQTFFISKELKEIDLRAEVYVSVKKDGIPKYNHCIDYADFERFIYSCFGDEADSVLDIVSNREVDIHPDNKYVNSFTMCQTDIKKGVSLEVKIEFCTT